jgi:Zn-dependent peptidase ImmA (M78 family)/transcriptional regulator with XRE-family HTH domain
MIGARITRARKAAGLSLRALAEQTGLSHTALNKFEHGKLTPSSEQLIKLGRTLGVKTAYLLRPERPEVKLEEVEYRKHSKTPKKVLDRIMADVQDQAERWMELLDLYPETPVKRFSVPKEVPHRIEDYEQLEEVAESVRHAWGLGGNPIPDMIDTLESEGLLVILASVPEDARFDGLAGKVDEHHVVVVSNGIPGDRQRLTLAHELGHRVLAGRLADHLDEEQACNRFAGAFLLPHRAIRSHLGDNRTALEWRELYLLKHEYGISMAACLFRAAQAGIISEGRKKSGFIELRKRGWSRTEPGESVEPEHSALFEHLVYRALAEGFIGQAKAAELLAISSSEFQRKRTLTETETDAAADQ